MQARGISLKQFLKNPDFVRKKDWRYQKGNQKQW